MNTPTTHRCGRCGQLFTPIAWMHSANCEGCNDEFDEFDADCGDYNRMMMRAEERRLEEMQEEKRDAQRAA